MLKGHPEKGFDDTSPDMECVIILQPHPHFSYVRFEYGQGEVSLWASHENGHGLRLAHIKPDIINGLVQLLEARLSRPYYSTLRGPRSSFKITNL